MRSGIERTRERENERTRDRTLGRAVRANTDIQRRNRPLFNRKVSLANYALRVGRVGRRGGDGESG